MSLAPVYLITSAYLMQSHLERPSVVTLNLSVLAMCISVWLVIVTWTCLSDKIKEFTYKLFSATSVFTPLIFILSWLGVLGKLVNLKASPTYIYPYVVIGLLLFLAIIAFSGWNTFRKESRNEKPVGRVD